MGPMAKIGFIARVLFAGWKFWTGPSQIRADVPCPLSYRTHVVGQADFGDRLPLLIVLHGGGAHEEDLDGVFEDWRVSVRMGRGYTWSRGEGTTQREAYEADRQMFRKVADSLAVAAAEVANHYPTEGKAMVFGFSAGASMAWYLGAHHPDRFDAIFVVAGDLDSDLLEDLLPASRLPFFAYHGKRDGVVSISSGHKTARAIEKLAGRVVFEEFDGGHTVPPSARADVEVQIEQLRVGSLAMGRP